MILDHNFSDLPHLLFTLTHQRPQRLPELLVRREDVEPPVQTRLLAVLPQRHVVVLAHVTRDAHTYIISSDD